MRAPKNPKVVFAGCWLTALAQRVWDQVTLSVHVVARLRPVKSQTSLQERKTHLLQI